MIIDSFLGFNEIELACFRIEYLWELTDQVIIGESRLTHSGAEKPLIFSKWIETRPDLQQKVKIIEIDLRNFNGNWEREIASRECLQNYLRINFKDCRAILSDLDEIPTKLQVLDFMGVNHNVHFAMKTFYRRANFALRDSSHSSWNHGVMIYDHIALPRNGGRYAELPLLESRQVGGHFSYLGMTQEQVGTKMKSFAHGELSTAHLDYSNFIDFCDLYGIDHLGRFQEQGMGVFNVLEKESFSSLLDEMYKFKPSWFYPVSKSLPFFVRMLASANVSHAIKNLIGSKSSRRSISFSRGNLDWIFRALLGILLQITRKVTRTVALRIDKFRSRFNLKGVVNGFSSQKAP